MLPITIGQKARMKETKIRTTRIRAIRIRKMPQTWLVFVVGR